MNSSLEKIGFYTQNPPDAPMLALWRAVFSLCHVDGKLAPEEMGFVNQVIERFNFSEEQKKIVYADMVARDKPILKFQDIEGDAYKRQFFRLARILIWCDGLLHDKEMQVIERIKQDLGSQADAYEFELRWLDRRPDMPLGVEAKNQAEALEIMIAYQMLAFMQELESL